MRRRGCWPRSGSATTRWRGGSSRRMRPRSAGCWKRWTPPRWRPRWGRGWPPGCRPPARRQAAGGASGGRWRWTARRCAAPGTPAATGRPGTCWRQQTSRPARCSPRPRWTARPTRSPRSRRCWSPLDLAGAVVTADALHAQREHAEFLVTEKNAHYILTVKNNQPSLHAQLKNLPWRQIPAGFDARDRGHGRAGCTAPSRSPPSPPGSPSRTPPRPSGSPAASGPWPAGNGAPTPSTPSPAWPPSQATPAQLAGWIRGHWQHRGPAPHPRRHLRRRRLPDPHRQRPPGHGHPAQPRHRHPQTRRPPQHRRRLPLPRPRRHPRSWPPSGSARHDQNGHHARV